MRRRLRWAFAAACVPHSARTWYAPGCESPQQEEQRRTFFSMPHGDLHRADSLRLRCGIEEANDNVAIRYRVGNGCRDDWDVD